MRKKIDTPILFLYGLWIAATYLIFVLLAPKSLVPTFALSSLIGGVVGTCLVGKSVLNATRDPNSVLRALFFGLTQLFIFRALIAGDTTAAFCASSAAVLVLMPFSKLLTREAVSATEWVSGFVGVAGVVILAPRSDVTVNALLSGLFQAASILTARRSGIKNQSLAGNTFLGLVVGGILCLLLSGQNPWNAFDLRTIPICTILIVVTQLYFLWASFRFRSAAVVQVSQSRIGWSVVLNILIMSQFPSTKQLVGASLVLLAALWAVSALPTTFPKKVT